MRGLLAYHELDEALGLTSAIDSELRDIRTGKNTQHGIAALVRHSRYVVFQMAKVVAPRTVFQQILERINRLRARVGRREGRMTGNITKIYATQDKSAVEVRQEKAKMLDFRRIGVLAGLYGRRMGHVGDQTP